MIMFDAIWKMKSCKAKYIEKYTPTHTHININQISNAV